MLKKLLKYDLKWVFKVVIVFYLLALFFAILTRLFFGMNNSFMMNIVAQICSGTTISMIVSIIINNFMRLWVRFKNNFYGDESYLTHTLPVEKRTLYISKILSSIITLFISTFVILLTLFVAYYSKENMEMVNNLLLSIASSYNFSTMGLVVVLFILLFLEFLNLLQSGYTGIILGHKFNSGKIGFSVLFGFITYIVTQLLVLLIVYILGLFNGNIMNLFLTTNLDVINISVIKTIVLFAILIYLLLFVVVYIVNFKLFKKGVNVD